MPKRSDAAASPAPADAPGFDQQLARLEAIVAELETGGLALEPAIERYQEGARLLRACRAILEGHKKRVEELTAAGDVEPYGADPDASGEGAG